MRYAEKGVIARLEPGLWAPPESYEWYRVMPEGVGLLVFCSGVQDMTRDLAMAQANVVRGVEKLAEESPDCIIVGGLPVLGHGNSRYAATLDYVKSLRQKLNIPLVTDLTATVDALRALGVTCVSAATPYIESVDQNHVDLLEDCGFKVLNIQGLRIKLIREMGRLPDDASYRLAKQVYEAAPQTEALFLFCPAWPVLDNVAKLEAELKIPVLTTYTVQIYSALKAMGMKSPVRGFGRLLEELPGWDLDPLSPA